MPDDKQREPEEEVGARAFIILEDGNFARHQSYQEALELVRREHAKDPTRKFIVVQLIASIEPVISSKVTRHF